MHAEPDVAADPGSLDRGTACVIAKHGIPPSIVPHRGPASEATDGDGAERDVDNLRHGMLLDDALSIRSRPA